MINRFPQAVTIAGSDSDGSAGMQADLETFEHYHVYGASIITACVAGNSYGIHGSVVMPLSFIDQEFKDLADDFNIKASKTGMLANASVIKTVVKNYQRYDFGPLVVDPVIFGNNPNTRLLDPNTFQLLKARLIPLATVLTPNYYEAQTLAKMKINDDQDMLTAGHRLQNLGADNVIIKGPHHDPQQKIVKDLVLLSNDHHFWLAGKYYPTKRKNGTGDTLSAGICAELAKGQSVTDAIKNAREYVDKAIRNPLNVGHEYGPINHFV